MKKILLLLQVLLFAVLAFGQTELKPLPAYPFDNTTIQFMERTNVQKSISEYTPMSFYSGTTVPNGGDRLVDMQNSDGGWSWPLTGSPPSPLNTLGPIAKGLAQAYSYTLDAAYLDDLTEAGALLLTKINNFSPSDGYMALALDEIFGGTTYRDHLNTNFYGPLANDNYNKGGGGVLYNTQEYVNLIRTSRAGSQANLATWDVGMGLVGAASCGVSGSELTIWKDGVKAEINELDGDNYYDVIGLAGGLYGLAFVEEEFDPTAGEHAAASDLHDLADILVSYQINMGGFAWNSAYVIPNDDNETIQETAYAILALDELDAPLYLDNIVGATDYIAGVQLGTGGWENYSGSGENNEVTGEALWGYVAQAITTTINSPTSSACGYYDFAVTVADFINVGAISLVLNYESSVFQYQGATINGAISASANGTNPGTFILSYFGGGVTLPDNAVLFTLHLKLLPSVAGTTTNLVWSNNPGDCEYAGPGGIPVYVDSFFDITYTIPIQPVTNLQTGLGYCTIQAAIDDPLTLNGHDISCSPGTYPEMVDIYKSIHLQGQAGQVTTTIVQAPSTLPVASDPLSNIILVRGAGINAEISGLTIQGPGPTACGSMGRGIFVRDGAYAWIHDNQILDIRDNVFSGCQNGIAIQVGRNGLSTSGSASIENNLITGYQKGAIVVDNTGSSASILYNTITGAGTTSVTAQNGIQISRGATASIGGNTVTGNSFHIAGNPWDWGACGILLYESGAVSLTGGNSLSGNDQNYYAQDATGALTLGAEIFGPSTAPVTYGYHITDYSNQNIDASNCTFEGIAPGSATLAQLFDIEDRIWHSADDQDRSGFVNVKTGNVYITHTETGAMIQYGVDAAVNGDVVHVKAGTYSENVIVDKDITMEGANSGTPCYLGRVAESIISAGGGAAVTINSDGVTLDGFEITNPGGSNAIYAEGRNSLTIINNIISQVGNTSLSGATHAIAVVMSTTANISGITITNNCIHGIHGGENPALTGTAAKNNNGSASGIGLGWSNASFDVEDVLIENNVISDIYACTNEFGEGGKGAYGIIINVGAGSTFTGKSVNPIIKYNTIFYMDGLWSHGIGLEGETPGAIVENNFINTLFDHKTPSDATAIMVEDNDGSASVSINNNSFLYLSMGVINATPGQVNASCNWYGSTTPASVQAMIFGPVTYVPWLTSGVNTVVAPNPGFAPETACAPCDMILSETHYNVNCFGGANGFIDLTVQNGLAPLTYSWTGPGGYTYNGEDPGGLVAGTYEVVVTADNGCTETLQVVIEVDDAEDPVIGTCPPTLNQDGCSTADIAPLAYSTTTQTVTEAQFIAAGGDATDNCAVTYYAYIDTKTGTCPLVVSRLWTVKDGMGNMATCIQTINVVDNTDPTVTCPPQINEVCPTNVSWLTEVADITEIHCSSEIPIGSPYPAGSFWVDNGEWVYQVFHANNTGFLKRVEFGLLDITKPRPFDITVSLYAGQPNCSQNAKYPEGCALWTGTITFPAGGPNPNGIYAIDIPESGRPYMVAGTQWYTLTFEGIDAHPDIWTHGWWLSYPTCSYPTHPYNDPMPNGGYYGYDQAGGGCESNLHLAFNTVIDQIPGLTVSDNCLVKSVGTDIASGSFFDYGTTNVTFTVTDLAGNTNTCQMPVVVVDGQNPVITCPTDVILAQNQDKDPYATGYATATDNCSGTVLITYSDDRSGLNLCNATGVIVRTWTATDVSNNISTCQQTITVTDYVYPVVTCPSDITVNNDPGLCSAVVNFEPVATDFGFFQGFENSDWVSGNYTTMPSTDWNEYNSPVTREISGTDGIPSKTGNAHAVINSTVLPVAPNDWSGIFSRLGGYDAISFGKGFIASVDVYFDLLDPAVLAGTYGWDVSTAANKQSGAHLRDFIFHATADVNGPILLCASNNTNFTRFSPAYVLTQNHATISTTGWYTLEWVFRDNGLGALAVDCNLRDAGGLLLWTETRSDAGDLIATLVGGNRYMWFTFLEVDKLAIDNTSLTRMPTMVSSPASGTAFPKGTSQVDVTATDACGNTGNCSFNVTVNDNEAPVITLLGDATVSQCEGDPYTDAGATALDNCDGDISANITVGGLPIDVNVPGTYTVTYNVSDAVPNAAIQVTRTVIVKPLPVVVSCDIQYSSDGTSWSSMNGSWPNYDMCLDKSLEYLLDVNTMVLNPADLMVGTMNAFTLSAPLNDPAFIAYWAAKGVDGGGPYGDWRDQMYLIITGQSPFFYVKRTTTDDIILVDGLMYFLAGNTGEPILTLPGDYPELTYTYSGTLQGVNGCTSLSVNVNMTFNSIPVISCPSNTVKVNDPGVCGASVAFEASSLGVPVPSISYEIPTIGVITSPYVFPVGTTTVTATASNGCGTDVCTFTVTVTDNEDPSITCPPDVTVHMNSGCSAIGVDLGTPTTGDNCTVVSVEPFVGSARLLQDPSTILFPEGNTVVTWIVTDASGNTAQCNQNVTVVRNKISGTLKYYNTPKTPMNNVTLQLSDGTNSWNYTTDAGTGYYEFPGRCAGNYTLMVTNINKPVGYINSTDAAMANSWNASPAPIEHIKFLAGDVSDDDDVTATDALAIQNYFVNSVPFDRVLNTGTSWGFWKAGEIVSGHGGGTSPYPYTVQVTCDDDETVNIYGMGIGDFNGSFVPGNAKAASASLDLVYDETKWAGASSEVQLPVSIKNSSIIGAVSLILNFPSEMMEVASVTMDENAGKLDWTVIGNELRIGWNTLQPLWFESDASLLIIHGKTTESFGQGDAIRFTLAAEPANELADGSFNVIPDAVLGIDLLEFSTYGIGEPAGGSDLMLDCRPNPFANYTTITYNLPVSGRVTIHVSDILGRKVTMLIDEYQLSGKYSIKLDALPLQAGVYTATLTLNTSNGDLVRTIKLIRQQ